MKLASAHLSDGWREVLLSAAAANVTSPWLGELDGLLAQSRISLCRSATGRDTISRIQEGGIDLAVLLADGAGRCGLRTLELVRAVTPELPCLLVTPDTGVLTLRRALELEAYSVIRQPVDAHALARLLVRILQKTLG